MFRFAGECKVNDFLTLCRIMTESVRCGSGSYVWEFENVRGGCFTSVLDRARANGVGSFRISLRRDHESRRVCRNGFSLS